MLHFVRHNAALDLRRAEQSPSRRGQLRGMETSEASQRNRKGTGDKSKGLLCRSDSRNPTLERTTVHGSLTSSAARVTRDPGERRRHQPSGDSASVPVSGGLRAPLLPRLRRPPRPIKEAP